MHEDGIADQPPEDLYLLNTCVTVPHPLQDVVHEWVPHSLQDPCLRISVMVGRTH